MLGQYIGYTTISSAHTATESMDEARMDATCGIAL